MHRRAIQAILLSLTSLVGCSSSPASSGSAGGGPACAADNQNDADNCGACGHSCLGGTCVAGACQPVELASFGPGQGIGYIALDEGFAYLGLSFLKVGTPNGTSCADKPMIVKVSRATHDVVELAPCSVFDGGGQSAAVMALAGSEIIWSYDADPAFPAGPNLQRVSIAGGPIVDLGDSGDPVAADATSIFYGSGSLKGHLAELAVGGGVPKLLAPLSPRHLTIDAVNVYVTFTDCIESCQNDWSLFAVPKAGGAPLRLASKFEPGLPPVARGDHVYFGLHRGQDASIARIPTVGGAIETIVQLPTPMEREAEALAVDDSDVYWISDLLASGSATGGTLSKAPIGGGPTTTLATFPAAPRALAVDDKAIVWSTADIQTGAGTLWLLAK
jgi:hypothetical protein